jgi:PilZ domain
LQFRISDFEFLHDMEVILAESHLSTFDYLLKTSAQDRREGNRSACRLECQCRPVQNPQVAAAWPATLLDISSSGFQLLLSRRFEQGTLLVVDVHDAAGQATRMLVARVARVTSLTRGRWIHGCAFSAPLTSEDLESLLKNSADPQRPNRKAS